MPAQKSQQFRSDLLSEAAVRAESPRRGGGFSPDPPAAGSNPTTPPRVLNAGYNS
jgi:hypothetical protein